MGHSCWPRNTKFTIPFTSKKKELGLIDQSSKPQAHGKFRITNDVAGFDHEGYAFFRPSTYGTESLPFVFAFGERP